MKIRVVIPLVLALVLLSVQAPPRLEASVAEPEDPTTLGLGDVAEFDLDSAQAKEMLTEFANDQKLSIEEAEQVFRDSVPIGAFLDRYRKHPGFGALWVTYHSGYEVHVRAVGEELGGPISELEASLGRKTVRHSGGASAAELEVAMDMASEFGLPAEHDLLRGTVILFSSTLGELPQNSVEQIRRTPGIVVTSNEPPRYTFVEESRSGADIWRYNGQAFVLDCTAAAMWKGTGAWAGMTGYLSAAHCNNVTPSRYTYVDGAYSHGVLPTLHTVCGPQGDWEVIRFSAPQNEAETFLDKRYNPPVETPFRIAGGYYVGQPSFKVGLSTNGTTGTNMGIVEGYGVSNVGITCQGVRGHLRYWHDGTGGDSGGPVFLFYNGQWYLGAVHNGYESSLGGFRYGNAIWDISIPSGHLCSMTIPCT